MQSADWDIFRYIIAVVDCGSAVAAADHLGVNGSTVLRRISNFEEQRGIRLFDRLPGGYSPTAECEAIIKTARQMQESAVEIDRSLTGRDLRLEGHLTVTTTDTFIEVILSDIFAEFCLDNPQIAIDISVTNNRLSLTSQDADVAIRASQHPPEHLIGQRVAAVAFAIYGPTALAAKLPANCSIEQLAKFPWVGVGKSISGSPAKSWLDENIPPESIKLTADAFPSVRSCVSGGGGFGILPCCLGDNDKSLKRMSLPIDQMSTGLWVLTHPDVQKSARVKAFTTHVARRLREKRDKLEGV